MENTVLRGVDTQKELISSFGEFLFSLVNSSNHKSFLFDYLSNLSIYSKYDLFSNGSNQLNFTNISLDENKSKTHLTPYHLSYMIYSLINKGKSKGQFETPLYLASFLSKKLTETYFEQQSLNYENLFDIDLGDIAAGTGNLVLAFLYHIFNRWFSKKGEEGKLVHFIENNLVAIDVDKTALEILKLRLLFFISYYYPNVSLDTLDFNIRTQNALIKKEKLENEFDIIIGNPPFMCYGLRNSQSYSEEFKNYLRSNYKTAQYKLPLYPLFIERSLELLRERGILGIITPDSFMLGKYYSNVREYILNHASICDISILDFEPFNGVTLGRTALTILRKMNKNPYLSFRVRKINNLNELQEGSYNSYINNSKRFYSNHLQRFQLYFSQQDKNVVDKWNDISSLQIKDIATIHTGVRSKIGQKNIISTKKKNKDWKQGIVSGKQVLPYFIDYQEHFIHVNPEILWSGGFNQEIIKNPKLFIRQTGDKIISALDTNGYYHLNNCHALSPKNEEINLYTLSVILNSKEFNRIYQILSMEKGRSFAQVDIDFLLEMQIPSLSKEKEQTYEQFYHQQKKRHLQGKKPIETVLKEI